MFIHYESLFQTQLCKIIHHGNEVKGNEQKAQLPFPRLWAITPYPKKIPEEDSA
jgi:hypothetical protein